MNLGAGMKKRHTKLKIFGVVLLAAICIGTVELIVCRFADPALYERIMTPVERVLGHAAKSTADAAGKAWDSLQELAEESADALQSAGETIAAAFARDEDEIDESSMQEATDPAIVVDVSYADPAVTKLDLREDGAILTGGSAEIVYYNQTEEPWASQPYGRDDISGYGCGPTSMAMLVSSLTQTRIDPAQMSAWAVQQGFWARRSGSYLSIVQGTAAAYGLEASAFDERTADAVVRELAAGHMFVALMGPGHFTSRGHFIILRGVTLGGEVLVADPASTDRSLTTWDAQLILDELSKSTRDGAPLWMIAVPEA